MALLVRSALDGASRSARSPATARWLSPRHCRGMGDSGVRCQRGVDECRPPVLGQGGDRGPYRAPTRAGAGTFAALIPRGAGGSFDFAFIDADKTGYDGFTRAV